MNKKSHLKQQKRSIITPLIIYQSLLVFLLISVLAFVLPSYVERGMMADLEETMRSDAAIVAQLIESDDDSDDHDGEGGDDGVRATSAKLEMELDDFELPRADVSGGSSYVVVDSAMNVLLKSRYHPIGEKNALPATPSFAGYAQQRNLQYLIHPFKPRGSMDGEIWSVIVFSSREAITETVSIVRRGTILCGVILWLLLVFIGAWLMRLGVGPIRKLAMDAEAIDENHLEYRFDLAPMPSEVEVVGEKLNDLLSRLQNAFIRERRFSASAAHELRTPVAELKAIIYMGKKTCDEQSQEFFEDCSEVVERMESLLVSLLTLTKREVEGVSLKMAEVPLARCVHERLAEVGAIDHVLVEVDEDLTISADTGLLIRIIDNLISNAVQYSDPGTTVKVSTEDNAGLLELVVANTCSQLTVDDMDLLAEPFWRKDGARTSGSNQGLGLSMVKVYCEMLGWQLETSGSLPILEMRVVINSAKK